MPVCCRTPSARCLRSQSRVVVRAGGAHVADGSSPSGSAAAGFPSVSFFGAAGLRRARAAATWRRPCRAWRASDLLVALIRSRRSTTLPPAAAIGQLFQPGEVVIALGAGYRCLHQLYLHFRVALATHPAPRVQPHCTIRITRPQPSSRIVKRSIAPAPFFCRCPSIIS